MLVNFYVTGGIRIVGLLFIEIVEYYDADNALASMVMALLSAGFAICCKSPDDSANLHRLAESSAQYTPCLRKNCAKLFLSELCQISINFNNF